MRTPLAWKNLTSSYSKCALAATGVGFAVVLMFMQIGFRNALIDNNLQIFTLFDADVANLAIVSKARYNISTEQRFSRQLLEQAAAFPGIKNACSVSVERGTAKVKVEGWPAKPVRVIAIELRDASFFADPHLYEQLLAADQRRAALVDRRSKPSYGFENSRELLRNQRVELNGQTLEAYGYFELGTDFGNDGTLLMSERMHGDYFPWRGGTGNPHDIVDIGLLQAEVGSVAELEALAMEIESLSKHGEIEVWRTDLLKEREREFWSAATPIGKIFFIGTIMGLVVGAIICYQIQFTDITDHMPEFATLKAMGYGPMYFWSVIVSQSFYLACLGFVPGYLVSLGLYQALSASSGLVMAMTLDRILQVWLLTLGMCIVSGALAIRKLFGADPASLF